MQPYILEFRQDQFQSFEVDFVQTVWLKLTGSVFTSAVVLKLNSPGVLTRGNQGLLPVVSSWDLMGRYSSTKFSMCIPTGCFEEIKIFLQRERVDALVQLVI